VAARAIASLSALRCRKHTVEKGYGAAISNVVPLEKVAKSAGYVNVERVLDRDDLIYEFKDMLKKDGPSMLLIKVNEFVEDAGRVLHDPPDITRRFMKAIS